jgi:hypothetical protein
MLATLVAKRIVSQQEFGHGNVMEFYGGESGHQKKT